MRLRTLCVNQRGEPHLEAAKTRIVAVWKPINDQPALGNLEIKVRVSIKKSWGVTATNAGRRQSLAFCVRVNYPGINQHKIVPKSHSYFNGCTRRVVSF